MTVINVKDLMDMAADLLDLTDNGWERDIYFHMSKLAEECGEVADTLNKSKKTDDDLGQELSDVIIVCAILALKRKIDLNQAIINKQEKRVTKLSKRFHNGKLPLHPRWVKSDC